MIWGIIETLLFIGLYENFNISLNAILKGMLWAGNRLWFLPVLLIGQCTCIILHNKKVTNTKGFMLIWLCIGIGFGIWSTIMCKIALFSLLVWIGFNYRLVEKNARYVVYVFLTLIVCLCITGIVTYKDGFLPGMKCSVMIIICMLGGISEYNIIKTFPDKIKSNQIICFLGRYSLYYYILPVLTIFIIPAFSNLSIFQVVLRILFSFIVGTIAVFLFRNNTIGKLLFQPANLIIKNKR